MKKYNFLLIIFFPIICLSQNWAENNAVWYYNQIDYGPPFNHDYLKYYAIGDTVILGDSAKILKQEYLSIYDTSSTQIIMKSENNQVFLYDSTINSYELIYNFNALPGDTISVYCQGASQDTTIQIVVDSISTININGNILGVQYVSQPVYQEYYMTGTIIETIGWTGFMFPIHSWADPPFGGSLRCYEDNNTGLYQLSTFACDYITSLNLPQTKKTKVFPNPTNGIVIIESEEFNFVELIDINGNKIYSGKETKIDISNYSDGLYLVKVVSNGGMKIEKIILKKNE